MIDWPKVVQDLEAENARLKKKQDALVAAAYRAAAEAVNEVMPQNKYEDQTYEYVAVVKKLTPADAEKALRELVRMAIARGFTEACEHGDMHNNQLEKIVDEVMEKNT